MQTPEGRTKFHYAGRLRRQPLRNGRLSALRELEEIFFGFYSSKLDTNDKILKLFPDAVTKRIYYCNQNNSVGILLPTENIKN